MPQLLRVLDQRCKNFLPEFWVSPKKKKIIALAEASFSEILWHSQKKEKGHPQAFYGFVAPKTAAAFQWRNQKILVGDDNKNFKHKTSKIRMSSPKLRIIFRPKSEIQTFFPPKFRWFPKKKKLRLIFRPKSLDLGWWGDASLHPPP